MGWEPPTGETRVGGVEAPRLWLGLLGSALARTAAAGAALSSDGRDAAQRPVPAAVRRCPTRLRAVVAVSQPPSASRPRPCSGGRRGPTGPPLPRPRRSWRVWHVHCRMTAFVTQRRARVTVPQTRARSSSGHGGLARGGTVRLFGQWPPAVPGPPNRRRPRRNMSGASQYGSTVR